jgi:hypothetical protein
MTSPETSTARARLSRIPSAPAPDTPAGRVLIACLVVGTIYVLLLIADNVSLANLSFWFVPLVLLLATIVTFSVASMLGSDYARVRLFELELARTVAVHNVAGQLPTPDTAIGEVLKEYVRTADHLRRQSRVHAYAAGASVFGAVFALGAAVFWGFSLATGTIWLTYLAVLVELPTFILLVFAVTVLGTSIGALVEVPGFDLLTPARWRHYRDPNPALDAALSGLPWLSEFAQDTYTSRPTARGPMMASRPLIEAVPAGVPES